MVPMRVLLVDDDGDATVPLVDALTGAGIEVARCHDPGRPAFPCKGLTSSRNCPLDGSSIDAVVASSDDLDQDHAAGAGEGTRCALRQYVPLVLIGDRGHSALSPFASSFADEPAELVDAVHAAVAAPLAHHEEAARTMFRQVLDRHDLHDVLASARVTRDGGGVRVTLRTSESIPNAVAEVACVRVAGAIRAIDSSSANVSVGVEVTDGRG
jgi:hypothetical protein